MVTTKTQKELLTRREAADLLGISERSLWNLTAPRGEIPFVPLGTRNLRYDVADLRAWIDRRKVGTATPSAN